MNQENSGKLSIEEIRSKLKKETPKEWLNDKVVENEEKEESKESTPVKAERTIKRNKTGSRRDKNANFQNRRA